MYPFMFIVRVRNKVVGPPGSNNAVLNSNIQEDNTAVSSVANTLNQPRKNSFGVYACVLQSASISVTAAQAVIMDSVSAIARPIEGTWLNDQIRSAFSDVAANEDVRNGMRQLIYNVVYGYES
jgi:hypothetical protein